MKNRPFLINLLLILVTFLFTLVLGILYHINFYDIPLEKGEEFYNLILSRPEVILWGLPYSLSLMVILLVHELGHFYACRIHGIEATLPYFIPAPTFIGTFGAFIKIKSPFTSKRSLFDVGVAGPVAGFLVALPLIALGIMQSRIVTNQPPTSGWLLGEPLIFKILTQLIQGPIGPNQDILIHPMAFAGWFGLLATTFNLFPIGQLDGGHILYALFGNKAYYAGIGSIIVIVLLGLFFWEGWLFWALVVSLIGFRHPPVSEAGPLDTKRKIWAAAAFAIFIISFTPIPISQIN